MRQLKILCVALVGLFSTGAGADTLRLTSGREIECVILHETPERYTIRRGYGVMDVPASMVLKASKSAPVKVSGTTTKPTQAAVTAGSTGRFPTWSAVVDSIARQPWGKNLAQIPATYIDNGVLKDVPYQSYASGDYEVNIYGDPDDPACIEVGIYRSLLNDASAKSNCVELIAGVLPNVVDAAIARAASREKDLVERYDFTIEITPPEAPDAYGGWWISIYDEGKLDKARATPTEIEAVTVATPPTAPPAKPAAPSKTGMPAATPAPPPKAPPQAVAVTGDDSDSDWRPSDIERRRSRSTSAGVGSSGGRVYVRGYYRKNGTYVSGHTRRR